VPGPIARDDEAGQGVVPRKHWISPATTKADAFVTDSAMGGPIFKTVKKALGINTSKPLPRIWRFELWDGASSSFEGTFWHQTFPKGRHPYRAQSTPHSGHLCNNLCWRCPKRTSASSSKIRVCQLMMAGPRSAKKGRTQAAAPVLYAKSRRRDVAALGSLVAPRRCR